MEQAGLPVPPIIDAQFNVAGPVRDTARVPRNERLATLGPVRPDWATLLKRPTQFSMSPQTDVAAEYGLVTFDLVAQRCVPLAGCPTGHAQKAVI